MKSGKEEEEEEAGDEEEEERREEGERDAALSSGENSFPFSFSGSQFEQKRRDESERQTETDARISSRREISPPAREPVS